jgi:hypothetical protein
MKPGNHMTVRCKHCGATCIFEHVDGELVINHSCWTEQQRKILGRARREYSELVDALCSKSWMGRNRHDSVVGLAKRLHDSQKVLRPLELEDVALAARYCIRKSGHDGPCNGLPRNDCHGAES